jgi:prepilin-type N-terminal cleavage/methylation domain-containing protein
MKKSALLLNLIQHLAQKKAVLNHTPLKGNAGYTLIELLVVIVIIGVLATISAPSWLSFINQRRVNAANEFVFRALQEAQSLAKNKKLSYSVSFRTNPQDNIPEVAIYPQGSTPGDPQWKSLGKNLSIKPGQILVGTNLRGENQKQGNIDYNLQIDEKITFDYLGALYTGTSNPDTDLTIVVAANRGGGAATSTMRCVKVKTLLGALKTGKGAECSP